MFSQSPLCGSSCKRSNISHTKKDFLISEEAFVSVGVPGLEPGKAGPESAVLPLHHTPICCAADSPLNRSRRCNFCFACAKVLLFFELPSIFLTFFIKKTKIRIFLLVIRQKGIIFAGNNVSIRCSSDKKRSSYSTEQKTDNNTEWNKQNPSALPPHQLRNW